MSEFQTLITDVGAARLQNATVTRTPLVLSHMAVGDGGGVAVTPNPGATSLVGEVHRAPLNDLRIDAENPSWLIAELVLTSELGPWTLREAGVYDEEGHLIFLAALPETYKATLSQGAIAELVIQVVAALSATDQVSLYVDPTVVIASRAHVAAELQPLRQAVMLRPGGLPGAESFPNTYFSTAFLERDLGDLPDPLSFEDEVEPAVRISLAMGSGTFDLGELA